MRVWLERTRVKSQVRRSHVSSPNPSLNPPMFNCDYCGRDGHKSEFCFKRKHEERMAKE
jgi:hypothetical protein